MLVAVSLVLSASAATAQTVNTKWHCPKAPSQSYDVGDVPGHVYSITGCTGVNNSDGSADLYARARSQ